MSVTTLVSADKARAYSATSYRLGHADNDIVLRIGESSPALGALFERHGVACGAFLTAFNPRGTLQADEANEAAHALLAARLGGLGITAIEGSGSEPGSQWGVEKSFFALGLDLPMAQSLGQAFDQDALVWVGADLTAQLIFLR